MLILSMEPLLLNRNYALEISRILEFEPSHLSCYLLTIEGDLLWTFRKEK